MTHENPSWEEITKYGIEAADEHPQPFSPEHRDWNDSYFFDWFTEDGNNAGYCRIGCNPVLDRIYLWMMIFNGDECLMLEENRLRHSQLSTAQLSTASIELEDFGLRVCYTVLDPLRKGRLEISGFGRVVSGSRNGLVLPFAIDLEMNAIGAAHSSGGGIVETHSARGFSTNRYEQPVVYRGYYSIGEELRDIECRGERDHSWGPRPWDMEWAFLVLHGEDVRLQAHLVDIPGIPQVSGGYLHRDETLSLTSIRMDLRFDDDDPRHAHWGDFCLVAEDDSEWQGHFEPIAGSEINIANVFETPRRPVYRRSFVQAALEDGREIMGWFECNRFVGAGLPVTKDD